MQVHKPQHQRLYPISYEGLVDSADKLKHYSDGSLNMLKDLWSNHEMLEGNPTLPLMDLEERPYLLAHDKLRRAYRVGVIASTEIVRNRLQQIDEKPDDIKTVLTHGHRAIKWNRMQNRRFILTQFFDTEVDVKKFLHDTVEAKWQREHVSFLPDPNDPIQPKNDWMVVGVGDTLAMYGVQYARTMHQSIKPLMSEKLLPEPEFGSNI